jgi:hypothetical protein
MSPEYGCYYRFSLLSWSSKPGRITHFVSSLSRPVLEPIQPPIQWVLGALSPEVKWQEREADHSPLTSAEVKKTWIYTSIPWTAPHLVLPYTHLCMRNSVLKMLLFLCFFSLFKGAVSIWALNGKGKSTMEWRNAEGCGRGLTRASIPQFLWRNWGNTWKTQPPEYISKKLPLEPTSSVSFFVCLGRSWVPRYLCFKSLGVY